MRKTIGVYSFLEKYSFEVRQGDPADCFLGPASLKGANGYSFAPRVPHGQQGECIYAPKAVTGLFTSWHGQNGQHLAL